MNNGTPIQRHGVTAACETPRADATVDAAFPLGRLPPKARSRRPEALTDRIRTFIDAYGRWCRNELTQSQAATLAQMSERTFRRHVRRYRDEGEEGLHDRRSKPSRRRASCDETNALATLYRHKYRSFSVLHFYREYRDAHGGTRSYTWVKNKLQQAGLVRRQRWRDPPQDSVHREAAEGALLHQCVSSFAWSSLTTWDLVVTIDDATNRVQSGFLVAEDTIWSRYQSIREVLSTKGRFDAVTCDWLGRSENRCMYRQLVRAIDELNITFMRARAPQAQERCDDIVATLKHCLPWQLAESGVTGLSDANRFLSQYWPRFNDLFAREAREVTKFSTVDAKTTNMLSDVLCLKGTSRIDSDFHIVYAGKRWPIPIQLQQRARYRGRAIQVLEYRDGRLAVCAAPR